MFYYSRKYEIFLNFCSTNYLWKCFKQYLNSSILFIYRSIISLKQNIIFISKNIIKIKNSLTRKNKNVKQSGKIFFENKTQKKTGKRFILEK